MSPGALYWWHLLSPIRSRARLAGMAPVVYMLARSCPWDCSASRITFAPDALYAFYEHQPRRSGA